MTLQEYLLERVEPIPKWLKNFKEGDKINMSEVLGSRVIYYPGAEYDGQPIKTFNGAHYAHVYVYVDYMVKDKATKDEFKNNILGYHSIAQIDLNEKDLIPNGWQPHVTFPLEQKRMIMDFDKGFFGFISIFQRDDEYDEQHGAKRFAVIYIYNDGIATYDALFANQEYSINLLVLQDHGLASNYGSFGANGLMERIAIKSSIYPKYILCDEGTKIWHGYTKVESVDGVIGGWYSNLRMLWKRNE